MKRDASPCNGVNQGSHYTKPTRTVRHSAGDECVAGEERVTSRWRAAIRVVDDHRSIETGVSKSWHPSHRSWALQDGSLHTGAVEVVQHKRR